MSMDFNITFIHRALPYGTSGIKVSRVSLIRLYEHMTIKSRMERSYDVKSALAERGQRIADHKLGLSKEYC